MAKPFTPMEVKRLIGEHQSYLSQLNAGESITEKYQAEIVKASKAFVAKEVLNLLKEIPVEEINRDKRGFRVKALRDHGYTTIADLAADALVAVRQYGIGVYSVLLSFFA